MVLIPGGPYQRGGDAEEKDGEGPIRISRHFPFTKFMLMPSGSTKPKLQTGQFKEFVDATDHVTFAERPLPEERSAAIAGGNEKSTRPA